MRRCPDQRTSCAPSSRVSRRSPISRSSIATSPRSVLSRVPGVKQITEGRSFGRAHRAAVRTGDDRVLAPRCGHAVGEEQDRRRAFLDGDGNDRVEDRPVGDDETPRKTPGRCRRERGSVPAGRERDPKAQGRRGRLPGGATSSAPPAPREPEALRDPGWRSERGRRRHLPGKAAGRASFQLIPSASSCFCFCR